MRSLSCFAAVISIGFAVGCESSGTRPDAGGGAVDVTQHVTDRAVRRTAAAGPATSPARGAPLFDNLGNYHHAITTRSPQAQQYFDQGLRLTYGFNHAEAIRSYTEAARLDPTCAMAWWGVALSYGPNINKPMDPADAPKAWDAIQKAQALAKDVSEQDRAYVEALSKRYAQNPPEDRSALDKAYADAMRELHQKYPDDLDAATLFAESVMDTTPWSYYTKEGQPKPGMEQALAALEGVLKVKPDHAGACHYYIHAVEAAEPAKAMAAADTLLSLCPGAGHLVHMPAHIYLRMGLYREATVANELASRADESYISQCNAQGFYPATYYPHNVHFLWYTHSMDGRSAAAMEAAKKIASHAGHMKLSEEDRLQPLVAMVFVRFGKWDEVLALPTPPADHLYCTAMSHYTRGLALAGKEQPDEAEKEYAALKEIAGSEAGKKLSTPQFPGNALLDLVARDLAGQIALKKGENDNAIAELQQAVKLEDDLPYMEPPFSYMPMRHGLGAALLAAGKPADAEKVYREDLRIHPNNGWALLGLAQSLKAQKQDEQASEVTEWQHIAWIRADVTPPSSRY
jgi:tetratricopeptide (TPR) repeat protein